MSEIGRIFPLDRRPPGGTATRTPQPLEPLWREVLGSRLRALRADRGETLAQTAERAGISPQYLSEVERGRKEPSSEMIAALAGALDITVADLMTGVVADLRRLSGTGGGLASVTVTVGTTLSRPAWQRPSGPVALAAAA